MHVRLLAISVLAVVALPAVGQAKTVRAKNVQTQGGATSCYATIPIAGRGIICSAESLPDTGELDPYVGLRPHGRALLSERGDYAGYSNVKVVTLKLHDRWIWHGITCTVGKDGMSCRNRDGNGFNLGPTGYTPLS